MVYRITVVAMAKTSLFRADQSMAPELSADRISYRGVSTRRGANGGTGREWKKLLPHLWSRLGRDCNICESLTSGPSHAIDITREAIQEGADAVIAVGGDGTLREVVNGFFWAEKPVSTRYHGFTHTTALGLSIF